MAVGYEINGEVAPLTDLGWNRPCGQMYSTVEDLNKVSSYIFDHKVLHFVSCDLHSSIQLAMFFYEAYNQSFFPKSDLPFSYVLSAVLRREMGLPGETACTDTPDSVYCMATDAGAEVAGTVHLCVC